MIPGLTHCVAGLFMPFGAGPACSWTLHLRQAREVIGSIAVIAIQLEGEAKALMGWSPMPIYQVEKCYAQEVLSSENIEEENPLNAAESIAGRPVSPRGLQPYWYRVVDERDGTIYEFALAETGAARDFAK